MCDAMTRWPNRQPSLRCGPKHQEAEYAGCRTSGLPGGIAGFYIIRGMAPSLAGSPSPCRAGGRVLTSKRTILD